MIKLWLRAQSMRKLDCWKKQNLRTGPAFKGMLHFPALATRKLAAATTSAGGNTDGWAGNAQQVVSPNLFSTILSLLSIARLSFSEEVVPHPAIQFYLSLCPGHTPWIAMLWKPSLETITASQLHQLQLPCSLQCLLKAVLFYGLWEAEHGILTNRRRGRLRAIPQNMKLEKSEAENQPGFWVSELAISTYQVKAQVKKGLSTSKVPAPWSKDSAISMSFSNWRQSREYWCHYLLGQL